MTRDFGNKEKSVSLGFCAAGNWQSWSEDDDRGRMARAVGKYFAQESGSTDEIQMVREMY